uniref:Ig-like domain-containing protein n=1 Tax=Poecilia formosa TaxID=48698 RepID=A0A096LPX9_POEFO
RPNSSHVFSGETITLTCEVQGGETTEWTYEWRRDGSLLNRTNSKDWMFNISESSSGNYMCRCRRRDDWFSSTQWSEAFSLSVSGEPVLSVSPSWLNPGASVTLSCEGLEHQPAGWRFFWYKAVPDPSNISGTEQTHTAGFVCRAGRGEPKFYTHYSDVKFTWSAGQFISLLSIKIYIISNPHNKSESSQQAVNGVFFYHNDKLIHNDSRGELKISARRKMFDGFYSRKTFKKQMMMSWNMLLSFLFPVTVSSSVSSSFPVMLIVGPVVGIVLIIVLLLLWSCRRSN